MKEEAVGVGVSRPSTALRCPGPASVISPRARARGGELEPDSFVLVGLRMDGTAVVLGELLGLGLRSLREANVDAGDMLSGAGRCKRALQCALLSMAFVEQCAGSAREVVVEEVIAIALGDGGDERERAEEEVARSKDNNKQPQRATMDGRYVLLQRRSRSKRQDLIQRKKTRKV